MLDDKQKPSRSNHGFEGDLDQLALLGGELLEGSGFETETPEPDSEWRDTQ